MRSMILERSAATPVPLALVYSARTPEAFRRQPRESLRRAASRRCGELALTLTLTSDAEDGRLRGRAGASI